MILRLEVSDACYVFGRGALGFLGVTQAGSGSADGLIFTFNAEGVERLRAEMGKKQGGAIVLLPKPIVYGG